MPEDQQAAASSSQTAPTLLTHLQALTQPSFALPSAYLHPYAPRSGSGGPASWKGKGRENGADSIQAQIDVVRAMSLCVEQAKTQLLKREGDWGKLSRALKEVVTHQNTLLPLSTSLDLSFLRPRNTPLLPSARIALPPAQLLPALAQVHDIQTYQEDSQFGLLKVTLTLAGNCFVVDIDLETDAAAEEDDGTAPSSAVPTPVPGSGEGSRTDAEGGTVRLSKIAVSYVTHGGGMEASEYVADVLRVAVEPYLVEWNSVVDGLVEQSKRGKRLEMCIRRIDGLLAELKALDGSIQVEGEDKVEEAGLAGLEAIAERIKRLSNGSQPIYPIAHPTICPSFRLFPNSTSGNSGSNPILQLRPVQPGEDIPIPYQSSLVAEETPTINSTAKWLVEVQAEDGTDGLVVRRNWLDGIERPSNPWDGGIKVENLLFKASSSESHANSPQFMPFPYQSTFQHQPQSHLKSLQQQWSLASPGPDGYVVGRLGLPDSDDDLRKVLSAMRKQIQLNRMFQSVFTARAIAVSSPIDGEDEDEDDDMGDLMAAPTAIPITESLNQDHVILTSPYPYNDEPGVLLRLDIRPDHENPTRVIINSEVTGTAKDEMRDIVRSAVAGLEEGTVDLVQIYQAVEAAVRQKQSWAMHL